MMSLPYDLQHSRLVSRAASMVKHSMLQCTTNIKFLGIYKGAKLAECQHHLISSDLKKDLLLKQHNNDRQVYARPVTCIVANIGDIAQTSSPVL